MRHRITTAAAALLILAGMTGCSTVPSPPTATPRPAVSTADWPTAQLYHTGRTTATLELPAGARSLHVEFSCTYGLYAVRPSLQADTRSGMCGGAQSFDFDVSRVAQGTHVAVDLVVPDGTRLAATLRYSTQPFRPDATTRKQCAALSAITEAYWNADEGHDHGDVTDAQWVQQTATAKTDLEALAASSAKDGASSGLLGTVIPELAAWLTGDGDHPGGILHAPLGDFTAADALAGQICSANGTSIAITSKYGG